jgi:serine/threonine protein kinase
LCAALAAAHAKGVLHRDFKPGTIMIDGRGQVLITDFGLAALATQVTGPEARHGTPAYMAPEQLAGKEASVRSDIYSLGLVLYEMFTGRRAFEAQSHEELLRMEETGAPAGPSTQVRDLEPDPGQRPSSAPSVPAALPGGDPLAAALVLLSVAGVAAAAALHAKADAFGSLPTDKSPEVLGERAHDLLRSFGYDEPPVDSHFGFAGDASCLDYGIPGGTL